MFFSFRKEENSNTRHNVWTNLEDIVLSETSPSQKDKYCMIPPRRGICSGQTHRDRQ